ncbi:ubiquinone anaerobic biosynthesis accessory factor UbiT [Massilia oculi]|uniref:ubiquinone anaerobic biosynthesis accessory factor UbiT n=1 Tax=Massilia oculi TaxID=945844 RepID=UPI001AAF50A1|nr:SCP2 sterol-binding domain-containing protein [Massilia oculi]
MHPESHPLPAPVKRLLSLLPAAPGSRLFATALNLALAHHLPDDVRAALRGKRLRLCAPDAGVAFDFTWNGSAFGTAAHSQTPDLTISASLRDFAQLAARKEDPDTLFFSRRLLMEGDTELGLTIKNTLDAIDGPVFELASLVPRRPGRRHG